MEIDKTTCWYDFEKCPGQMIAGSEGKLWPILEKSDHFPILDFLINSTSDDCSTLLDLGCGAADLSRIISNHYYVGADLENIIQNVAKVRHPTKNYIHFDIYGAMESCKFIADYDIIVTNAFIDVLQYPVHGLKNILSFAKRYVIIHRQEFDNNGPTRALKNPSYGGLTYHSIINVEDFTQLLNEYKFKIDQSVPIYHNNKSLLLKKES